MKNSLFAATVATALTAVTPLFAATINPSDYDAIYTEGKQVTTLDGADISGNEAIVGNGDVATFTMAPITGASDVLIAGRVVGVGDDAFQVNGVSGKLTFDILAYGTDPTNTTATYSSVFSILVNGTTVDSVTLSGNSGDLLSYSFASLLTDSDDVKFHIQSVSGRSVYNVALNVAPVPLPAGLPLVLTGAAALAFARRRKVANR